MGLKHSAHLILLQLKEVNCNSILLGTAFIGDTKQKLISSTALTRRSDKDPRLVDLMRLLDSRRKGRMECGLRQSEKDKNVALGMQEIMGSAGPFPNMVPFWPYHSNGRTFLYVLCPIPLSGEINERKWIDGGISN